MFEHIGWILSVIPLTVLLGVARLLFEKKKYRQAQLETLLNMTREADTFWWKEPTLAAHIRKYASDIYYQEDLSISEIRYLLGVDGKKERCYLLYRDFFILKRCKHLELKRKSHMLGWKRFELMTVLEAKFLCLFALTGSMALAIPMTAIRHPELSHLYPYMAVFAISLLFTSVMCFAYAFGYCGARKSLE